MWNQEVLLRVGLWHQSCGTLSLCYLGSDFIVGNRERDCKVKRSFPTGAVEREIITKKMVFRTSNSWNIYGLALWRALWRKSGQDRVLHLCPGFVFVVSLQVM